MSLSKKLEWIDYWWKVSRFFLCSFSYCELAVFLSQQLLEENRKVFFKITVVIKALK